MTEVRAALYIRQSDRYDKEQISLDVQERDLREYCAARGWQVHPAHVFVERHSGVDLFGRPELARLMAAMRAGEIDVIVCWNTSRFSREPDHLTYLLVLARFHGVQVRFAQEDFDHDSDEGWLLRQVYGFAAKQQWRTVLKTTYAAKELSVRQGRILAGRRPLYGYRYGELRVTNRSGQARMVRGRYVPDPVQAEVVRQIFTLAAAGWSKTAIARHLNERGIPTAEPGGRWHAAQVSAMIRNPAYKGEAQAWKYHVPLQPGGKRKLTRRPDNERVALGNDVVPALVDPGLWQAANDAGRHHCRWRRHASRPETALLREGLVVCALCARGMVVTHNGRGRYYYRCMTASTLTTAPCGKPYHVPVDPVDQAVWRFVTEVLTDANHLRLIADRVRELAGGVPLTERLSELEHLVAVEQQRLQALARDLADLEGAARAAVKAQLNEVSRQLGIWEQERDRLQAQRAEWQRTHAWVERLEVIADTVREVLEDGCTYDLKRQLLRWLGVTVRVWPRGRVAPTCDQNSRLWRSGQAGTLYWEVHWQPRLTGAPWQDAVFGGFMDESCRWSFDKPTCGATDGSCSCSLDKPTDGVMDGSCSCSLDNPTSGAMDRSWSGLLDNPTAPRRRLPHGTTDGRIALPPWCAHEHWHLFYGRAVPVTGPDER